MKTLSAKLQYEFSFVKSFARFFLKEIKSTLFVIFKNLFLLSSCLQQVKKTSLLLKDVALPHPAQELGSRKHLNAVQQSGMTVERHDDKPTIFCNLSYSAIPLIFDDNLKYQLQIYE